MAGPIVRNYDKHTHKRCIKCRQWKLRVGDPDGEPPTKAGFGKHDSSDGLQSICHTCKNKANTKARDQNTRARLRHHIATRCLTQLGPLAPDDLTKNLEDYLGYKISMLEKALRLDLKAREGDDRKLRDALNEGYHIDHIKPLSSYDVVRAATGEQAGDIEVVDWDIFRECWDIDNLSAISAEENLAKGASYEEPSAATPSETPEDG